MVALQLLAGCGSEPDDQRYLWPIGGTKKPRPISSSFGPRLQKSRSSKYDFHRGIDIPTFIGSHVLAIDAGKVVRSGHDPEYADLVVQIEHCKSDGHCFYSTYLHLSEPIVAIGDHVEAGQLIAYSGVAESNFPHLHFEVRDGQSEQDHCVHPLHFLPTPSWLPPAVTLGRINTSSTSSISVDVDVDLPSVAPGLLELAVTTSDRTTGKTLDQKVFNTDDWNRKYTPDSNPDIIDNPDLEGIHIEPAEFNEVSPVFSIHFRFSGLKGTSADKLVVTARARDVNDNHVEARSR